MQEAQAALASSPPPQQNNRREVLLNGSSSFPRPSTSSLREPAPRIVPQSESRSLYKPPVLLSILLTPINLLYRIVSGSLSLFGYLFPFLPRIISSLARRSPARNSRRNTTGRRPLNPRDTAARFIREFEEEYSSHELHFFEDGYAQAYDLAKRDLRFLLVVLISPEHDDNATFIREVLLSPEVGRFINDPQNNIILWAGSVQDSEAYQVSIALNCTKFPFAALIAHTPQDSSTSMSTVTRVSGLLPPSAFVARLQTGITQQKPALDRIRATRAEQQANRNLRQQQESAYERSLAQDRERTRQRREAEAAKVRAEHEARSKAEHVEREKQKLEQWKEWKSQQIAPEPGTDMKDVTRLSIRMPSGDRIVRRFSSNTSVEDLYAFVECYELSKGGVSTSTTSKPDDYHHHYRFNMVSPMPRMVYDIESGGIVGERIGKSGNLIVEPILEEEDED